MAVAGRVAIVPKEDYVPGMPFKRLDLVRYGNKIYLAKKDGSGIDPPNETYWMLMITNADVSAEVEDIQMDIGILSDAVFGKSAKVPMVTKDGKQFVTKTGAKFVGVFQTGIGDIRNDTYYNRQLIGQLQEEINLRDERLERLQEQLLASNQKIQDLQSELAEQAEEIQVLLNRNYFAPVIRT